MKAGFTNHYWTSLYPKMMKVCGIENLEDSNEVHLIPFAVKEFKECILSDVMIGAWKPKGSESLIIKN